jgi:hypothetical protein
MVFLAPNQLAPWYKDGQLYQDRWPHRQKLTCSFPEKGIAEDKNRPGLYVAPTQEYIEKGRN